MNASDIEIIAKTLMDRHGLHEWRFEWDRAVRRAGCCKYRYKKITLSWHFVTHNLHNVCEIIDTVLHEIAHALAGPGKGHGPEWRAACDRTGAKPERCYDATVVVMPKGKWRAICGGCGREFRRHRQTRRQLHCRRCGPDRGSLVWNFAS